jgi:hypothetical protein
MKYEEIVKLKAKDRLVARYGRSITVFTLDQWNKMVNTEIEIIKQGMRLRLREMNCKTGANL